MLESQFKTQRCYRHQKQYSCSSKKLKFYIVHQVFDQEECYIYFMLFENVCNESEQKNTLVTQISSVEKQTQAESPPLCWGKFTEVA